MRNVKVANGYKIRSPVADASYHARADLRSGSPAGARVGSTPMSKLREYERQAITVLTAGVLSERTLAEVLESEVASVDHTGVGYFATVRHSSLPKQHIICHEPIVFGTEGDLTVGFLVILMGQAALRG